MCNGAAEQQRLQHRRRNRLETPLQAGLAATAGPSSAGDGSTISTTRRPGATSSCSTIGTSASRPGTSAIGDFPSYNYMSDVTKRGEIFGLESTAYFGAFYNTLTASSDRVDAGRQRHAWQAAEQYLERHHQLWLVRARN